MTTAGPQQLSEQVINAKLAELDSVPLFMQSLPDDEIADNPTLAALQSLAHEGTPDEVAQNFKEQGNDYFKGKRYREALGFYTQAIDAKPTDSVLQEALLCNRAACNLELQNYGSVLRDCSKAILLNPSSSKAFYRSTLALLCLERAEEAIDCCRRCLVFDPDNKAIQALSVRAQNLKETKDKKERERWERLRKERESRNKLNLAFRERNLVAVVNPDGSANPYSPHFDPEDSTGSTLIFPVFFLYPQYATSDVIPEFIEDTPFSAHLQLMFPPQAPHPEWDAKRQYINGQLVIYAITKTKRLLKVGKKMSLRDVCKAATDGLEVKDGCLTFVVLPKGQVESDWVAEFKRTRD